MAIVAESMVGGFNHPHSLGLTSLAELRLGLHEGQKLVVRRVNLGQRNRAYIPNDVFNHEPWFVWRLFCDPDCKVLPLPSELILIGKAESQDSRDACLDTGFGSSEHR